MGGLGDFNLRGPLKPQEIDLRRKTTQDGGSFVLVQPTSRMGDPTIKRPEEPHIPIPQTVVTTVDTTTRSSE